MSDPYVYPGTQTLINKYNIYDLGALQDVEAAVYVAACDKPLPQGKLDYTHLKAIHRHFFGEIYGWAGQTRTVDISKSNSLFCRAAFIEQTIHKLFNQLQKEQYLQGLEKPLFCKKIAHYFNEINAVHPFREGNGRTLRVFIGLLAQHAGYTLTWEKVDPSAYLQASIEGFNSTPEAMEKVFQTITEPFV